VTGNSFSRGPWAAKVTPSYAFQFDDLDPDVLADLVTDEMLEQFALVARWDDMADKLSRTQQTSQSGATLRAPSAQRDLSRPIQGNSPAILFGRVVVALGDALIIAVLNYPHRAFHMSLLISPTLSDVHPLCHRCSPLPASERRWPRGSGQKALKFPDPPSFCRI
jgi:hypothetical protein